MEGKDDVNRLLSQNKQQQKPLGLLNQESGLAFKRALLSRGAYAPDRGKKVSKFPDDTDLCEFWPTTGTFYIVQKKTIQTAHKY